MKYEARAPLVIHFGGDWTDGDPFAGSEGGAALSATIARYAAGAASWPSGDSVARALRSDRSVLQYAVDVPPGADLGEDAARILVWLTLTRTPLSNTWSRLDIARAACQIASILDILCSSGDVYASALGGISYLTFGEANDVVRLALDPQTSDHLRSRLVLAYVSESRLTPSVYAAVWEDYRSTHSHVAGELRRMKGLAQSMRLALEARDIDGLGSLVREHWEIQKALNSAVTTTAIDEAVSIALRNGAIGARASGRGGSGSILAITRQDEKERLQSILKSSGIRIIDFDFDTYGVFLKKA